MPLGKEELQNRFGFHAGTDITVPKHENVRQAFFGLAMFLDGIVPDGDAKDEAFKRLQEAAMWSNFSVSESAPLRSATSEVPQPVIPGVDDSVEPQYT